MIKPRVHRLVAADGRCFDVAIDHGFFCEDRFLRGIENAAAAIETVVAAEPDAVQLSVGQAPLLQNRPGGKPALVHEAEMAGMPVMIEPLAMRRGGGGYDAHGELRAIRPLVRQAVELGADIVKADPTDEIDRHPDLLVRCSSEMPFFPGALEIVRTIREDRFGTLLDVEFADAVQQMWAAFVDGLVHERDRMRQPFHCATPEEAAQTHRIFTAALADQAGNA